LRLADPTHGAGTLSSRQAEEYKKMSSKEKRQLRNKLSARAFRNRRKTYINELEDHIKDRDRLIDAIRNELKNFRSENDELRCGFQGRVHGK
jgi:16S rRNA A1518/A1519 N6-dimethyltransferase RsmA/KsgA/DIM1 with predicted DNA glycosylase/AP lyase activity